MNLDEIREDIRYFNENHLFFNSAGSSIVPHSVVERITNYLKEEEKYGGYFVANSHKKELNLFYNAVANLIHCKPHNVAFAYSATDAYTKALSSVDLKQGDVVMVSNDDYVSSHFHFLSLKKRLGIRVVKIKNLENGEIDLDNLQVLVDEFKPKIIALAHVPTNSGLIQNIEAVGNICNKKGIIFILDACQSVGQLEVDVRKIKCDFLTATGRKFLRGPRGTGFLFVSDRILNKGLFPLMIDLRGAVWEEENSFRVEETAKRFESFEISCALLLGLTESINYANTIGLNVIEERNSLLMSQLRKNLSSLPKVNMFDKGIKNCSILTFRKEGKELEEIDHVFRSQNVFFSVSRKEQGLIDFSKKGIDWVIRLSPHYFNTVEEIDQISEIIENI